MESNELYQYSIVSALMDGVASQGLPIASLLRHGDHGLGTFRYMAGEMVILDGQVYQMKSDGTVVAVRPEASPGPYESDQPPVTPFAMTTRFHATRRTRARFENKAVLANLLGDILSDNRNHYLAFRIEGTFRSVTVRTVAGQDHPGERLAELGKRQVSHVLQDMTGTVIGFRSPGYTQGISVAGDHLHFISEDLKYGGHVLALESKGEVLLMASAITNVHMELPHGDAQFNEAALEMDNEGIKKVEG
jgi:alpha-acetolactate decarboxylase